MSTTSIIATILFALACIIVAGSANAQYGGPPMWDRNDDDYQVPRGPQMGPCIGNGDCWGAERQLRYPPGWYDPRYERPMRRIPRFPQPRGPREDYDE